MSDPPRRPPTGAKWLFSDMVARNVSFEAYNCEHCEPGEGVKMMMGRLNYFNRIIIDRLTSSLSRIERHRSTNKEGSVKQGSSEHLRLRDD